MITVFYDGKCGLCRREIAYYKRNAPQGFFEWVDITLDASGIESLGVSYADGLKLLHVQDETGKLYNGIDAFLIIWRQMEGWKYLGQCVGLPVIHPIARAAYAVFAAWRFRRLSHCQIAISDDNVKKE